MQNAEIAERRKTAIARGVGMMTQIYVERAENAEVWDVEGNRYIDFAAGIAVVNTGHRHPKVMAAVHAPARRLHPHLPPGPPLRELRPARRAAERGRARRLREADDVRDHRRRGGRERGQDRAHRDGAERGDRLRRRASTGGPSWAWR